MSHEIVDNMMFSVKETPWHKQGTVLQEAPTCAADALRESKLDWTVVKLPLSVRTQIVSADSTVERLIQTPFFATGRFDADNNFIPFGSVTADYELLQNHEAFRIFDETLIADGWKYETAGALKGGQRVWILARAPYGVEAGNDKVACYALLTTGHDGKHLVNIMPTPVRVVCNNTLTLALSTSNTGFRIHHRGDVAMGVDRVMTTISHLKDRFMHAAELWDAMQTIEIEQRHALQYFVETFKPSNPDTEKNQVWDQQVGRLLWAFRQGRGNNGKTLYDAYNAVTEVVDHLGSVRRGSSVEYSQFGSGARAKVKAFDIAQDVINKGVSRLTPSMN